MLVSFACISDSIPPLRSIRDNPLAYPSGAFAVIFALESQFNYLFTWKKMYVYIQIVATLYQTK